MPATEKALKTELVCVTVAATHTHTHTACVSLRGGQGLLQELLDLVGVRLQLFVVEQEWRLGARSHVLQQMRRPATVSWFSRSDSGQNNSTVPAPPPGRPAPPPGRPLMFQEKNRPCLLFKCDLTTLDLAEGCVLACRRRAGRGHTHLFMSTVVSVNLVPFNIRIMKSL